MNLNCLIVLFLGVFFFSSCLKSKVEIQRYEIIKESGWKSDLNTAFSELKDLSFVKLQVPVKLKVAKTGGVNQISKLKQGEIEVKGKRIFLKGTICDFPNLDSHKKIYAFINDELYPMRSKIDSRLLSKTYGHEGFKNCGFQGWINFPHKTLGSFDLEFIVETNHKTFYRIDKFYDVKGTDKSLSLVI